MKIQLAFAATSICLAFLAKILTEVIHEILGHGLFVLLFGGRIINVHISILWPFEFSYVTYAGAFTHWQETWITAAGIIVCSAVYSFLQALLLLKTSRYWQLSLSMFWLALWTSLSSTGYLVIGGIEPFGDVDALIQMGFITQETALATGLVIFTLAFFGLSRVWLNLLTRRSVVSDTAKCRFWLFLLWLTIPIVVATYCLGTRQPLALLQTLLTLSFIPSLVAFVLPSILPKYFSVC